VNARGQPLPARPGAPDEAQVAAQDTPLAGRRLLIVVNVAWFFAMHRLSIARMAREAGMDVHVACGEGSGEDAVIAAGFPFHRLPFSRAPYELHRDLASIPAFVALYRRLRPDIVHHVTLKPIVYGTLAARLAGVPGVVNSFAGLGYTFVGTDLRARLRRAALERVLRLARLHPNQRVIVENEDDLRLLRASGAVSAANSSALPGVGVDLREYEPVPESPGRPAVLFASRMLREKGVEQFVEAARRLRAAGNGARFVLAGTPDPSNPGSIDEAQLRAWAASGDVEWLGFTSDMPALLRSVHVVCLPTYYREGVPRILLEGAAAGRPLVTTTMPGCTDICRHESNGLLVPPRDVVALAAALERLLADAALRARYGAAGRALVEREFALDIVLARLRGLYVDLLDGAMARGRS
jgi:glycosyltransferase involved in cell wall biosynthesis